MFMKAFEKVAVTLVTMSPEEFYDVVGEKDPPTGALLGAIAGGAGGALKGKKGRRAASALKGAVGGAAAGGATGYAGGKALRHYQANRIRRLSSELHLRSTPGKQQR